MLVHAGDIEFPGICEQLNNPDFNPVEFDGIRKQAGLNSFILTAKQWIEKTHARGLISKPRRYGGTFAHKDIAKRLHMHHIVVYFRKFVDFLLWCPINSHNSAHSALPLCRSGQSRDWPFPTAP